MPNAKPGQVPAACLAFQLEQSATPLLRQVGIPVFDKGTRIPLDFRFVSKTA
jgi:hypothetical protein